MDSSTRTPPDPDCRLCPRLVRARRELEAARSGYWNRPVPATGSPAAGILIVGLAPGLHGANRTGRPFHGDASGDFLREQLQKVGLTEAQYRITNAVKCWPPENRPLAGEVRQCNRFLAGEIADLRRRTQHRSVLLALGRIAHQAVCIALERKPDFAHGHRHPVDARLVLLDSYHCSRYNRNTGRLSPNMFRRVLALAKRLAFP